MPGQLLSSIDPRSRAGLANLASMFAGGPKSEDILGGDNFEPYSLQKAQAGGHIVFREGNKVSGVGGGRIHGSIGETLGPVVGRNLRESNPRTAAEHQNMLEQQSMRDLALQAARHRMAMRRQMNDRLGAAPMQHDPFSTPHETQPEIRVGTKTGSFHELPEGAKQAVLKALVQRRYQAQLGRNHRN